MAFSWGDIGQGAMTGGINTAINMGQQLFTDFLNQRAQERQAAMNERAAISADLRQRALYNDLYSPKAMIKQFKEAGLSPSLMASNGAGGGGTSGAQSAGVGIQTSSYTPFDMGQYAMQSAQIELLKAQAKNVDADTDKKKGETASIYEGIKQITAQTAKTWADVGATQASTALTQAQTTAQELINEITTATKEDQIKAIEIKNRHLEAQIDYVVKQTERENVALKLDRATFDANVQKAKEEVQKIATEIAKMNKDMKLTDQQIIQIVEQLGIAWTELGQKGEQIEINRETLETAQRQFDRNMKFKWTELGINSALQIQKNVGDLLGNIMKMAMLKK